MFDKCRVIYWLNFQNPINQRVKWTRRSTSNIPSRMNCKIWCKKSNFYLSNNNKILSTFAIHHLQIIPFLPLNIMDAQPPVCVSPPGRCVRLVIISTNTPIEFKSSNYVIFRDLIFAAIFHSILTRSSLFRKRGKFAIPWFCEIIGRTWWTALPATTIKVIDGVLAPHCT